MDGTAPIVIQEFGATGYKSLGWATVDDIPKMTDVRSLTTFLSSLNGIGLIDLTANIGNGCKFSTHDDSECTFEVNDHTEVIRLILAAYKDGNSQLAINNITKYCGKYILNPDANDAVSYWDIRDIPKKV